MATSDPPPAPERRRNWWIWGCAALAVVAVGLLVWGVNRQSQLNDSQQQVADLEAQAAQTKDTGTDLLGTLKGAYDDLVKQLGATNEDLEQTQSELADAQQTADQAQQDADKAKQDAADAKSATEKAQAEAEQAKADAKAAESKATIVKDCTKAYVSAIGGLFTGAGTDAVRQQLQSISADCSSALGGS